MWVILVAIAQQPDLLMETEHDAILSVIRGGIVQHPDLVMEIGMM